MVLRKVDILDTIAKSKAVSHGTGTLQAQLKHFDKKPQSQHLGEPEPTANTAGTTRYILNRAALIGKICLSLEWEWANPH